MNLTDSRIEVLEFAIADKRSSDSLNLYESLVTSYITIDDLEAAWKTLETAETKAENGLTHYLTLLKGWLMKKRGLKKEGNQLLRTLECEPDETYSWGVTFVDFCDNLLFRGKLQYVDEIYKEASKVDREISYKSHQTWSQFNVSSRPIYS